MARNSSGNTDLTFRHGIAEDCPLLATLNHQLIPDEGHRNRMTITGLEQRMREWLSTGYAAVLFETTSTVVAYALYRETPEEIHLRQFFVVRNRRRQGIGRRAVEILRTRVWASNKRLTVDVLTTNTAAIGFWRAIGFSDYCLTLEILPTAQP